MTGVAVKQTYPQEADMKKDEVEIGGVYLAPGRDRKPPAGRRTESATFTA